MSFNNKDKIMFYYNGNDIDVSGSNHYGCVIWPDGFSLRFIVDCGQYFGKWEKLNHTFPYRASRVDLAFMTHPHIDHCGKFPKLIHDGFQGPIFTTVGSALLYPNAIYNSGGIVLADAKKFNRTPDFTLDDIKESIENVEQNKKQYNVEYEYNERVFFTFVRNQHIFGASSIKIRLHDPNPEVEDIVLFFEGDYNDRNQFLENHDLPKEITDTDYSCFFAEATYGNTESKDIQHSFCEYLEKGVQNYDNIVIFAFAFGRTQDVLFLIKKCQESGLVPPETRVFLDGNLAIDNTYLISQSGKELEIRESARDFLPKNLTIVDRETREHHIYSEGKKIFVTSSGMSTYGPAPKYLSSLIGDPRTLFIYGGYCTPSSVGGYLMGHNPGDIVSLFGQRHILRATIVYTSDLSGHGRVDKQLKHLAKFRTKSVIIVHGDLENQEAMKERVKKEIRPSKGAHVMERGYTYVITCHGVQKIFYSEPLEF